VKPSQRRGIAMAMLTIVAVLALTAFAAAGQLSTILAARTPLPPPGAANPGGHVAAMTAGERARSRTSIGAARIAIPSVGVSARWIPEVLTGEQLGVPADVHTTGLWSGGGRITGASGTVLIDGHVNYVGQGDGALFPIAAVKPGALVATSTRSGSTVWWRTVRVVRMLKQALPQGIFTDTGARRLVVVTCGGVLESDGHYDDNVVLFARPLHRARRHGRAALAGHVNGVL
jgi:hypothetical protein